MLPLNSSSTYSNFLEFFQLFLLEAEQVIGYSDLRRGHVGVNGGGLKFLCIYCVCALVCVNRGVGVRCSTVTVCERDRIFYRVCGSEREVKSFYVPSNPVYFLFLIVSLFRVSCVLSFG